MTCGGCDGSSEWWYKLCFDVSCLSFVHGFVIHQLCNAEIADKAGCVRMLASKQHMQAPSMAYRVLLDIKGFVIRAGCKMLARTLAHADMCLRGCKAALQNACKWKWKFCSQTRTCQCHWRRTP